MENNEIFMSITKYALKLVCCTAQGRKCITVSRMERVLKIQHMRVGFLF